MAFDPITTGEINADSPLKEATLRKFRENIKAHNHSVGQGAPLVLASFLDGFAITRKLQDAGMDQDAMTQKIGQNATDSSVSFFPSEPDVIVEDTAFALTVTHGGTIKAWLMAFYSVEKGVLLPGGSAFEIGLKLDGTVLGQFVRIVENAQGRDMEVVTVFLLEQIDPGTHTITPLIKGKQITGSLNAATSGRISHARMIGAS